MNTAQSQATVLRAPPQRRYTRWHNPTDKRQTVIIEDSGEKFAFTVEPGDTQQLEAKYDRVIHQVDCGRSECHRRGWWCTQGHDGIVCGGSAPLLQREGANNSLDPSLDPGVQAMKEAKAHADDAAKLDALKVSATEHAVKALDKATAPSATTRKKES